MIDEHRAIIGFNETIRNWHEERYFTSSSRGIGIQFSTSNNTTSLNDHWLVYRHCAKLRNWGKVEKFHLPYKQTTPLSPISLLFVCNFSAQLWQCWKRWGSKEIALNVEYQISLDFAPKHRAAEEQSWSSSKGWRHLPGLSDVEIRMGLLKLGFEWYAFRSTKQDPRRMERSNYRD